MGGGKWRKVEARWDDLLYGMGKGRGKSRRGIGGKWCDGDNGLWLMDLSV